MLSPYCRHYVADELGDGEMIDGRVLRCPFHHWRHDMTGRCVGNAVGNHVPNDSAPFAFPTEEK